MRHRLVILAFSITAYAAPASAHPGPYHDIERLTKLLASEPGRIDWLMERARAYRFVGQSTRALEDLDRAARLGGDALQIAGVVRIGGCGGELYRPFLIYPWTDRMQKVWTINRDCCVMQKDESVAGVTCSTVAYKIHKYQVKMGVAPLIYHRPAHGEGMEGHQAPWLSLGDHSMLEPGMCFSVEPGLFDTEHGFGTNFSDTFVIERDGPARQMSRLPWSEEWSLVKL